MAQVDVSSLLLDPDFTDRVTLIRRTADVDENGELILSERQSRITVVVEAGDTETLLRFPEAARFSDLITVYYRGILTAEQVGGYADIIIWHSKRYQVKEIAEDWSNWGPGWTKATCMVEAVRA